MLFKKYIFTAAIATLIPVASVLSQGKNSNLTAPSTAQTKMLGLSISENISDNIIIEEEIVSINTIEVKSKKSEETNDNKKTKEDTKQNRWDIKLSDNEIDLLAKILWVEARGESDKGQRAVVEVVLNRMIHKEFSGSLEDVLSAKNQFSSWGLRNSAKPTEKEYSNIKKVLDGKTEITNFQTVYFSTSPRNSLGVIHIGGHYFCEYELQ